MLRIQPDGDVSRVRLRAHVDGFAVDSLKPSTRTVHIQLAGDTGEPLICARIDATQFRASRRRLRFRDKSNSVPETEGLSHVRIRRRGNGDLTVSVKGRRAKFVTGRMDAVRVGIGLEETVMAGVPPRCFGAIAEPLRPTKRGGVKFRR